MDWNVKSCKVGSGSGVLDPAVGCQTTITAIWVTNQPNNNNCNGVRRLQYGKCHMICFIFLSSYLCVIFLIFSSSNIRWSIEGEGTVAVCFVNLGEQEMFDLQWKCRTNLNPIWAKVEVLLWRQLVHLSWQENPRDWLISILDLCSEDPTPPIWKWNAVSNLVSVIFYTFYIQLMLDNDTREI